MKSLRSLIMLAVVLFPLSLAAQSNEFGVFISQPRFDSGSLDFDPDLAITVDFDENIGYGISYNRYWTSRFSTEFSAQRLTADTTLNLSGLGSNVSFDAGDIELTALSAIAQWHFAGQSRVAPYVGAGFAHVSGEATTPVDVEDPAAGDETQDLKSETSLVLNAGVDFKMSPRLSIFVDAKKFAYDADVDEPDSIPLGLDPLVFAAGVKLRF